MSLRDWLRRGRPGTGPGAPQDPVAPSVPFTWERARTLAGRTLVLVVLDSCRYDTLATARCPAIRRLGPIEERYSYASWTAPSHFNLLMGLMPHHNRPGRFAAHSYREELARYQERLGVPLDLAGLMPSLSLPALLQQRGWNTTARVSLPVLNPQTAIAQGFSDYRLMEEHNDLSAILDSIEWARPQLVLINTGETHYPYSLPTDGPSPWPRVSGLRGAIRHLGDEVRGQPQAFFSTEQLVQLKALQVRAVEGVDRQIERLYEEAPEDAWIIITSDHGELFGEDGGFGHGPFIHPAVFTVPFVEGPNPRGRATRPRA